MPARLSSLLLAVLVTFPLAAATRMTYEVHGTPTTIEWPVTAFPLRYEVDRRLAQLSPNAVAMVDRAFAAWAAVPGADVRFESRGVVTEVRSASMDRIVVSLADDLLADQGAAAITSFSWDVNTGRMLDGDIAVDPSLFNGDFNGQMALQHEVGHILGLDHSAVISSIMFPYVGPGGGSSEFDSDDRIAIATIYPKGDPTLVGATLQGRVTGDEGGIFAAQVVAVNERGQPIGTVLTNSSGEFKLAGIPPGKYRMYVEPLDGPVDLNALQGTWRHATGKPFPTAFFSTPIEVENGNVYGNLVVNTAGAVQLNPKWVGVVRGDVNALSLSTTVVDVLPGETIDLAVAGDGFTSGMTEFEVLNPSLRRVSDFQWASNFVRATYLVEPDAQPASSVIVIRSGNDLAMLTGAVRVHRPPRTRAVRR